MPCAQNEKAVLRRTAEKTLVNRVLYSITDFGGFVKSGLQIFTTKKEPTKPIKAAPVLLERGFVTYSFYNIEPN